MWFRIYTEIRSLLLASVGGFRFSMVSVGYEGLRSQNCAFQDPHIFECLLGVAL